MTRRTIGSVMDDINEWNGPNGTVYYVTAFFTDKEVLSVGKKDMDAALEVKGLLQEIIEVPQEFILEPKGQSKSGLAKWNLKAFGPPEGTWTYSTIKDGSTDRRNVQGWADSAAQGTPTVVTGTPTPALNIDASIRASVALKAAAASYAYRDIGPNTILERADVFDAWLAKKSSGEALPTPEDQDGGADGGTANRAEPGEASAPSSTTDGKWTERVKDWPDPDGKI